jgi:hypothetical protein
MRYCLLSTLFLTTLASVAQTPRDAIINTERSFARKALDAGTRTAFLTFMSDSAVMQYRDGLSLAKPIWQKLPDKKDKLLWGPAFADASVAGDLGYTYGPWYSQPEGRAPGAGYFFTLWKRQPDGTYQFMLDLGVEHTRPEQPLPQTVASSTIATNRAAVTSTTLLELDNRLSRQIHERGTVGAYTPVLSQEAVLFRSKRAPAQGFEAATNQLASEPAMRFQALNGHTAGSGDIAYVYGSFTSVNAPNQKGLYVRVWKNEATNGWRLVAEVLNFLS